MSYSSSWAVIPQTVIRRERWPGLLRSRISPLVSPGQEVLPDQPILRVEAEELLEQVQASSVAREGLLSVPAGLHAQVVNITPRGGVVLESRVAMIRGTLGVGNQVVGVLTLWQNQRRGSSAPVIPPGAILVVPGPLNLALLRQAMSSQVAGIVASSIPLRDLEGFLRTDLLQLLRARDAEEVQAHLPSLTLLLTEGLGSIALPGRIADLLRQYHGALALLSGVTSLQNGSAPELLISLPEQAQMPEVQPPSATLELGAWVRILAGEVKGAIGQIDYMFIHEQHFPSGVRARAVRIRSDDGSLLVVPIAHVQRIE